VIAAPADVDVKDRASIKRTITLTWAPGDGPRLTVIDYGGRRGTRTYDGALVTAVLTYEWNPIIGGWTSYADLSVVAPYRDGWSKFPVRANGAIGHEQVTEALHQQYKPRTTVALTEQEHTP